MAVLHLLYVLVFTVLAVVAVSNLIRNMFILGRDMQGQDPSPWSDNKQTPPPAKRPTPHPELLDDAGKVVDEPLMVMRAMPIDDVRSQLDALYDASPSGSGADSSPRDLLDDA